ncbi:MAG: hypothetical protein C0404_01870, partial [Verrucomicrobia bacterium]|nr:hypothetical protein [Verrucomicrobiota bacterium]
FSSAQAGDTILLASGNYGQFQGGVKSGRVTIRLQPGATVTMEVSFNPASNITFDGVRLAGLQVSGSSRNLVFSNVLFTAQVTFRDATGPMNVVFDHCTWGAIDSVGYYEGRLSVVGSVSGPCGITVQNSKFGPGGNLDGIQTGADGLRILNNEFVGIRSGDSGIHTDAIQLYGSRNTVVRGNYIHDCDSGIMAPDGTDHETIEHNVIDPGDYPYAIMMGSDDGSVIRHNTLPDGPAAWGMRKGIISIGHKSGNPPSTGTVVQDNVLGEVSIQAGSSSVTANYNLVANAAAVGAQDIRGLPTYVGGTAPATYAGFALTTGSLGKGNASDGTDRGITVSSGPPAITAQPANQSVFAGQTATFSVSANGTGPLAYRWQTNSVTIAGATNLFYTTPASTLANSGTGYRVIITNSFGSVTSSVATLTVLPPDNTAPAVVLTAPANGSAVSNTVTISATATDPSTSSINSGQTGSGQASGVAGVQFKLDGVNLDVEDTVGPHSISWNTRGTANGSHTLTAVARDSAGNATTSTPVTVTVTNNAASGILGNDGEGTTTDNISDGSDSYINASRFMATNDLIISVVKAKVLGITGKYKCAIYSDNGGVPQTLLKSTDEAVNPSTGWRTFTLTSAQAIQSGSHYWLAIWSDLHSTSAGIYCDASGGSTRWTGAKTYGSWPDPITTTGGGSLRYCIYAEAQGSQEALVNGIPSSWLIQYFGGTNVVNGHAQEDWDHDGMNNLAEYIAGTIPTNAGSILQVSRVEDRGGTNLVIKWSSVAGKFYAIKTSTNLLVGFDGVTKTNIPATPTINTQTVSVDQVNSRFYRVAVEQ